MSNRHHGGEDNDSHHVNPPRSCKEAKCHIKWCANIALTQWHRRLDNIDPTWVSGVNIGMPMIGTSISHIAKLGLA